MSFMLLHSCSAARGSGLKLLSTLPGKWSMSSPTAVDDGYSEGEVLGRLEFVESSEQELIIVGIYYENVTSSSDVKNQKSLRVKLANDTSGELVACRQGGNKFSFSSTPIPLNAKDVVHLDVASASCFNFTFSFHPNLKDALWTASGPAAVLGNPGTFHWIIIPSSHEMVLTLHSAISQDTWSITAIRIAIPGLLSHWAPWILLIAIVVMSRIFARAKTHPRLKPVPDKFAKRTASNPTSPKNK